MTVPVRPLTLLTDWFDRTPVAKSVIFATTCVWLAEAAETSEATSVTVPVRPLTLETAPPVVPPPADPTIVIPLEDVEIVMLLPARTLSVPVRLLRLWTYEWPCVLLAAPTSVAFRTTAPVFPLTLETGASAAAIVKTPLVVVTVTLFPPATSRPVTAWATIVPMPTSTDPGDPTETPIVVSATLATTFVVPTTVTLMLMGSPLSRCRRERSS